MALDSRELDYLSTLRALAPDGRPDPTVVLLTPGVYKNASSLGLTGALT